MRGGGDDDEAVEERAGCGGWDGCSGRALGRIGRHTEELEGWAGEKCDEPMVLLESSEVEDDTTWGPAMSDPDETGEYMGMPWGRTGSNSHSKVSRKPKNELLSAEDRRLDVSGR